MNKTILFNTEMFEALLNGKKTVFVIPIESKKIKDETFVSYFHPNFTTFKTSYHSVFSISHPFKIGDTVEIREYRKKRSFLIKIETIDVERVQAIDRKTNLYNEHKKYWDLTNKKGYKLEDNPFAYVCSFELLRKDDNKTL